MQLSSRILTALAVLILAVTVVAVRAGSPETVEAATGDISVLNVGTCYTTNTDAFAVGACKDGQVDDTDDDGIPDEDVYNVGGRDSITKVDTVYATYAIDPKTSGDQPRAILKNSDLIKISIEDAGRDKRTGVLYAVEGTANQAALLADDAAQLALNDTLKDLVEDLNMVDHDDCGNDPRTDRSHERHGEIQQGRCGHHHSFRPVSVPIDRCRQHYPPDGTKGRRQSLLVRYRDCTRWNSRVEGFDR